MQIKFIIIEIELIRQLKKRISSKEQKKNEKRKNLQLYEKSQ